MRFLVHDKKFGRVQWNLDLTNSEVLDICNELYSSPHPSFYRGSFVFFKGARFLLP